MPKLFKGSRKYYNIHSITTEREANQKPLDDSKKNIDVYCDGCKEIFTISSNVMGRYVNCPICGKRLGIYHMGSNHRLSAYTVVDNKSLPTDRPLLYRKSR